MNKLTEGKPSRDTLLNLCGDAEAGVLIDIMEKFDMLIPCPSHVSKTEGGEDVEAREGSVQRYLVPCLMKKAPESVYRRDESIPTLHFKCVHRDFMYEAEGDFPGVFLPHGLFHRLSSRCCRTKKWTLKAAFYDYMAFEADNIAFSLRMVYNSILLSVSPAELSTDEMCEVRSNLRQQIQAMFDDIVNEIFPNLTYVLYLKCIISKHGHSTT